MMTTVVSIFITGLAGGMASLILIIQRNSARNDADAVRKQKIDLSFELDRISKQAAKDKQRYERTFDILRNEIKEFEKQLQRYQDPVVLRRQFTELGKKLDSLQSQSPTKADNPK